MYVRMFSHIVSYECIKLVLCVGLKECQAAKDMKRKHVISSYELQYVAINHILRNACIANIQVHVHHAYMIFFEMHDYKKLCSHSP